MTVDVVLLDYAARIVWMTDMGDADPADLRGKRIWELGWTSDGDAERIKRAFAECLVYEAPQRVEFPAQIGGADWFAWSILQKLPLAEVAALWILSRSDHRIVELSPRERQVCQLVGRGHGGKTIAKILHCAHSTVITHKMHARQKLRLNSTEFVVWCGIHRNVL